jgi:hypothetical protein
MKKNLILLKMIISQRFAKAHSISFSELKHEVFDITVCGG